MTNEELDQGVQRLQAASRELGDAFTAVFGKVADGELALHCHAAVSANRCFEYAVLHGIMALRRRTDESIQEALQGRQVEPLDVSGPEASNKEQPNAGR